VGTRDPNQYGPVDYMFIAVTDIDQRVGSASYKARTSTSDPNYLSQVDSGMLACDRGRGFRNVTDGTSHTILVIEDAGRSHPSVAKFGAYSSRVSPVVDNIQGKNSNGVIFSSARRVFAWADPDAFTNGLSGPSNAVSPQSRIAKINNSATPIGGPVTCPWDVNNCGPNDEPFSFHSSGVNAVFGDGSCRFLNENIDALVLRSLAAAADGNTNIEQ
jgi:prepilin-type processing-associated H-X9-DG protein